MNLRDLTVNKASPLPIGHILHMPYGDTPRGYLPLNNGGTYDPITYPSLDTYIMDNGGTSGTLPVIPEPTTGTNFIKAADFSTFPGGVLTSGLEQRIQENTARINQIPGLRAVPPQPDLYLPLISDVRLREGEGVDDMLDASDAQDGSVMIRSGTKSATFTRASTGTYESKSGVLMSAEINTPRIEAAGLLLEPSSTNVVPNSHTPTWITLGTCTVEVDTVFMPDGTTPSLQIDNISDTAGVRAQLDVTTGANTGKTYTTSLWVMGVAGEICSVSLVSQTGAMEGGSVRHIFTGVWERISFISTFTTSQGTRLRISMASGGANSFNFGFVQVEEGGLSSYIPTSGGPSARSPDVLFLQDANYPVGDTTISMRAEFDTEEFSMFHQRWADNTRYLRYSSGLEARGIGYVTDIGDYNTGMFTVSSSATEVKAYVDGTEVASVNRILPDTAQPTGGLYIGSNGGTSDFINGHIRDIRIWDSVLPIDQVRSVV